VQRIKLVLQLRFSKRMYNWKHEVCFKAIRINIPRHITTGITTVKIVCKVKNTGCRMVTSALIKKCRKEQGQQLPYEASDRTALPQTVCSALNFR
jgi:hypothetical protein